jgi:hypothetical protein
MDVRCVHALILCLAFSCVLVEALRRAHHSSKESYRTWKMNTELNMRPGPWRGWKSVKKKVQQNCRGYEVFCLLIRHYYVAATNTRSQGLWLTAKLLLALASTVFLSSESHGTHTVFYSVCVYVCIVLEGLQALGGYSSHSGRISQSAYAQISTPAEIRESFR